MVSDWFQISSVGRSSVLKVKPTPRPSEAASTKRTRSAQRTPKRKVLMDDPMVLHGEYVPFCLLLFAIFHDMLHFKQFSKCMNHNILMFLTHNL